MDKKEFLTTKEAAAYLGIKLSYLYKMTAAKTIPFYTPFGRRVLFKKCELDDIVNKHRVSTVAELQTAAQTALV